ncbi:hypothetical protein JAV76_04735 [Sanguibacter sp. YZGR15]|uniref:Uncharacterized protein n=2 Tax=Sanguibacter suaedae TaxID=2795737 RepID=A0A934I325_9MICO|nr:hypothetical protein [Sanguibacter suaedae]
MALMPRLRQLMRRTTSASTIGARRPTTGERRGDTLHEDALRAMLVDDPNNIRAFQALSEVVRRRASEGTQVDDPLSAPVDEHEKQRAADLAAWSLGEELAGNPRAWYPLIELARLSLHDDQDAAIRRLATAADRDPTGEALTEAIAVLRDAGLAVEALGLGVGHWRAKEHVPSAGQQVVRAALDADRVLEAKHHLESLQLHPDSKAVAVMSAELRAQIAQAEQHMSGT